MSGAGPVGRVGEVGVRRIERCGGGEGSGRKQGDECQT